MKYHECPPALLSRAGRTLQALVGWFTLHPEDRHPTVDQLAQVIGENRKFVQRGIKDLAKAGLILIAADLAHAVNRSIDLAPAVAGFVAEAIAQAEAIRAADVVARTDQGPRDTSGTPEVAALRSPSPPEEVPSLRLDRDTSGTGGSSAEPTASTPLADPLGGVLARLNRAFGQAVAEGNAAPRVADLGHLEHQPRLPIEQAPRRGPALRVIPAVARLEHGGKAAVEDAVTALVDRFGPRFEQLSRKLATAVELGRYPVAALIGAVEEATAATVQPGRQGFAFAGAAVRRFPGLVRSRKGEQPAAGTSARIAPTAGQESPEARSSLA